MNDLNRVPPYDLEAEQSILGAVLLDNNALLIAADDIAIADFYRESHRLIFSACHDLYQNGDPIDLITLVDRLKTKGCLEEVGGISYLSSLFDFVPTAANVRLHSRIVKNKSFQRRAIRQLSHLKQQAEEDAFEDPVVFLRKIEFELIELSQGVREKQDPNVTAILKDVADKWKEESEGIRSYISVDYKLDSAIPRYVPGHLWVVGGYTSTGKSTFLTQQIVDTCEEGARCIVFTLEDSREEKLIMLLANQADMSKKRLMLSNIEGYEGRIAKAAAEISKWHLKIYDDIYSVDEMRLKIKKEKLQQGADIIFLDYIQQVQGEGSQYDRLSDAVTKLQRMAKELQVTIIFVSQVTNESMKANSELIGLKGSGDLSACADIILWLNRVKGKDNERHLDITIKKNRPFGETGTYPLMFSSQWSRIEKRGF